MYALKIKGGYHVRVEDVFCRRFGRFCDVFYDGLAEKKYVKKCVVLSNFL